MLPLSTTIGLNRHHIARFLWRDEPANENLLGRIISHIEQEGLESIEANEDDAMQENALERTERYMLAIAQAEPHLPFVRHQSMTVGLNWLLNERIASHVYMFILERNFFDGLSFHLTGEFYLERARSLLIWYGSRYFEEMHYWDRANHCDSVIHSESLHASWRTFRDSLFPKVFDDLL